MRLWIMESHFNFDAPIFTMFPSAMCLDAPMDAPMNGAAATWKAPVFQMKAVLHPRIYFMHCGHAPVISAEEAYHGQLRSPFLC